MICYGGPLDGQDVGRDKGTYFVHRHLFTNIEDETQTHARYYRYQGVFWPVIEDIEIGRWPTNACRPSLGYSYKGEFLSLEEAQVYVR